MAIFLRRETHPDPNNHFHLQKGDHGFPSPWDCPDFRIESPTSKEIPWTQADWSGWFSERFLVSHVHMHSFVLSWFSRVQLFETLWTVALQAPLSRGFSRQEHWSGLPCPPPGDLLDPGMEPTSLTSPVSLTSLTSPGCISTTWEAPCIHVSIV